MDSEGPRWTVPPAGTNTETVTRDRTEQGHVPHQTLPTATFSYLLTPPSSNFANFASRCLTTAPVPHIPHLSPHPGAVPLSSLPNQKPRSHWPNELQQPAAAERLTVLAALVPLPSPAPSILLPPDPHKLTPHPHITSGIFLPKTSNTHPIQETSCKPRLRGIPQEQWPGLSKHMAVRTKKA